MKTGRPFNEVLAEVKRIHDSKRDYSVDTSLLTMSTDGGGSLLSIDGMPESEPISTFSISDHSRGQILSRLAIPADYAKRLGQAENLRPLLDHNVNTLFRAEPATRLVRTLDGGCRAFLSDRYQVIDNYDIMATVLPEMQELTDRHGAVVESCELTESRMLIKIKITGINYSLGQITEGEYRGMDDLLHPMIYIGNSEVGKASVTIGPGIWRKVCENGLMVEEASLTQYHVGRGVTATKRGQKVEGGVERLFSDETKEAEDRAFLLKIRDVMRSAVTSMQFENLVQQFGQSKDLRITRPASAVEVITKRHGLTETEGERIMNALIAGGDLSMYGLTNAVTRAAQDARDYDRATELEELGGKLIGSAAREVHREIENNR